MREISTRCSTSAISSLCIASNHPHNSTKIDRPFQALARTSWAPHAHWPIARFLHIRPLPVVGANPPVRFLLTKARAHAVQYPRYDPHLGPWRAISPVQGA